MSSKRGSHGMEAASLPGVVDDSYRELFHRAPTGACVTDWNGRILDFNQAMLAPGGYGRADFRQLGGFSDLCARPSEWGEVCAEVRRRGTLQDRGIQLRRRDGSLYQALLSVTPVVFGGAPCVHLTVEDDTARRAEASRQKELETRLWQAQKMAAIGELTADIAHDFSHLLSIISVNLELLGHSVDAEDRQALADVEAIRDATQDAARMVGRLLGFSRHATLTLRMEDLRHVASSVVRTHRHMLPPTVDLQLEIGSEPMVTLCDAVAVEQMLLNVITNARDAMPDGGTIRVSVDRSEVLGDDPGRPPWMEPAEYVRIAVVDDGSGMDDETLGKVFEPFFSTKAPGSGTGLGMSMVYGLAKQQGGYVLLESRLWQGTTASLFFPREDPHG